MKITKQQFKELIREVYNEVISENEEKDINVEGSVVVTIKGIKYGYDYEAEASLYIKTSHDDHPYGMGTAREESSEVEVNNIDLQSITPIEDAPDINTLEEKEKRLIISSIYDDVRDKASKE